MPQTFSTSSPFERLTTRLRLAASRLSPTNYHRPAIIIETCFSKVSTRHSPSSLTPLSTRRLVYEYSMLEQPAASTTSSSPFTTPMPGIFWSPDQNVSAVTPFSQTNEINKLTAVNWLGNVLRDGAPHGLL